MSLSRKCKMGSIHLTFAIVLLSVMVAYCPVSANFSSSSSVSPIGSSTVNSISAKELVGRRCNWLYRENPKDCRSYYQCLNGKSLLRRCPKQLRWNAEGSYCDWQYRTGCKSEGKGNSITGLFDNQNGDVKDLCPANTYRPYPTDCNKYIQCGLFDTTIVQQCGPGLHWDTTNQACNWPDAANCKVGASGSSDIGINSVSTTTTSAGTTVGTTPTPSTMAPPPTVEWPTAESTTTTTTQRPTPTTSVTVRPSPPSPTQYPILIPPTESPFVASDFKVVCYFTGWSVYRPSGGNFTPSDIDSSLCTHIIYAFACMNERSYKLEMCDSWIDGPTGRNFYGQVNSFRKQGIKTLIAVGGWNDSAYRKWTEMLKDLGKMETFIQSVCEFTQTHGFDGLDLDYEYPSCPQANCNFDSKFEKQAFVALVKGLRLRCGAKMLLSAAVSCNENIIREAYDVPTLSKNLDFFNLMAYDFHGALEPRTGINAPLYKIPQDEQYLNTYHAIQTYLGMKAPAEKLNLGMPMYGQSFKLEDSRDNGIGARATGPGTAGQFTRQKGLLAYYEICSQDWTEVVHDDKNRVGPYRYNAGNGEWVSHESGAILKEKSSIIKELGLGGGMIWSLDLDDWKGLCGEGKYPLLSVLKKELLGPNNRRRKASKGRNPASRNSYASASTFRRNKPRTRKTKPRS